MAKEKSLDLAAVQTWLAAWKEKDLYSDAAVRDLLSLIPDNYCMVVITCGVGCPPRSLVFRRWRRVVVLPPTPTIKARVQPQILDPDQVTMFHGPTPPMAPTTGQLWLKEGVTPKWSVPWVTQKIFRWDGTQWVAVQGSPQWVPPMPGAQQGMPPVPARSPHLTSSRSRWRTCAVTWT